MPENTHPLDQEEVMAYLDGELPNEGAARAAEHLRECRECQELAADIQNLSRHMAAWQIDGTESEMTPAIASALQHQATSARNFKPKASRWEVWLGGFRIPRPVLAVSGAVLALLLVAVFMTTQHDLALRQQSATMAESQVSESAPVAMQSSSQVARRMEGADRDRLGAPQAQMASNMEYAARPAAPKVQTTAPTADSNSEPTFYAASSRTMIARTAQLTIVVKDFDASQKKLEEILKRHGGYVAEMTTSAPQGADRKLSATLRVPSSQLDSAIADVKEIGRVESESQSGEEVTSQYVDLQARLTNARNTEQRLTELLRRQTGKLDEVVTVEEKISEVREQIERMEAERKNLGERVDFGTLSVSLGEERKAQLQVMPPSVGTQFHNAAVEGYRSVVDGIVSFLVFLMSWGPSLLLWAAVLFLPVRFAWRKLRRETV
jgi:anti-sigma factor RsiW